MEKFFVYAIQSLIDKRVYVGITSNIERRLDEHNKGQTRSTSPWKPWKLIYKKMIGTRKEAREIEKKLKSGYGKEFLKAL